MPTVKSPVYGKEHTSKVDVVAYAHFPHNEGGVVDGMLDPWDLRPHSERHCGWL